VAVPFVFGKPWHAAVVPTQILAGVGMFNAWSSSVGPHVLALGRAGLLSGLTWFAGFVYGLAIYLATSGGLIAVSATALGYSTVAFFVAWHLLVNRPLGLRWSHLARDAGAPFVVAAAIVAVCYPLTQLLRSADVIAPVTLAATGVAALAIYLALMPRLDHEGWRDVRRLVGGARRAGRTNGNGPAPAADAALATTGVSDLGAS
jgi:O-antigen/teichoic acid export membrane protein